MRCSAIFRALIDEVAGSHVSGQMDVLAVLRKLLDDIAPGSPTYVFSHVRSLSRIMHQNDYLLDKAFVHCALSLSKWLVKHDFPILKWPPVYPSNLYDTLEPAPQMLAEGASSPSVPASASNNTS